MNRFQRASNMQTECIALRVEMVCLLDLLQAKRGRMWAHGDSQLERWRTAFMHVAMQTLERVEMKILVTTEEKSA